MFVEEEGRKRLDIICFGQIRSRCLWFAFLVVGMDEGDT